MENLIVECSQRLENINRYLDRLLSSINPVESINVASPSYAQEGEDIFIINAFRSLGISHPSYIDLGANHPIKESNTALLHSMGCMGITVEANANLHSKLMQHRPEALNICCGVGAERGIMKYYMIDQLSGRNGFNLDKINPFLQEYPSFSIQKTLDLEIKTLQDIIDMNDGIMPQYMSIDIEGMEREVIEAYNFDPSLDKPGQNSRTPIIITVELNDRILKDYLTSCGYVLYFRIGGNYTFIKNDYYLQMA